MEEDTITHVKMKDKMEKKNTSRDQGNYSKQNFIAEISSKVKYQNCHLVRYSGPLLK